MTFWFLLFLCSGIGVFVLWLFLETDLVKKSKSTDSKQNNKNNGVLDNNNESENENKNLLNKQETSSEKQIINKKLIIFVVLMFIIAVAGLFRYEDYKSNISVCDYFYYIALDRANNVDDEIESIILQTEAITNYSDCIDNA